MELYTENLNQTWSEVDSFTVERYHQFNQYLKDGFAYLILDAIQEEGGMH